MGSKLTLSLPWPPMQHNLAYGLQLPQQPKDYFEPYQPATQRPFRGGHLHFSGSCRRNLPGLATLTAPPLPPALELGIPCPFEGWPDPPAVASSQEGGHLALFSSQWSALVASPAIMHSVLGLELEHSAPPTTSACISGL